MDAGTKRPSFETADNSFQHSHGRSHEESVARKANKGSLSPSCRLWFQPADASCAPQLCQPTLLVFQAPH